MTQTTARIKKNGNNFEIIVDLDKAMKFRKGESSNVDFLEIDEIFNDSKKGMRSSENDLEESFKTSDPYKVAEKIVKEGEILLTQDYRDEKKDKTIKQAIDIISKSAINPQTGNPHTPEGIKSAFEQANINLKNLPVEDQIPEIVEKLKKVIPIKVETKKIKITIPAVYTGKVYGIINPYKGEEKWLSNGDLEVVVNVPAGTQLFSFYDKLNSITQGSAITEELKNE
ncbi:MAG: ribosome assembly factor SBDS [Candidatus Pacearchaeota archaeon]